MDISGVLIGPEVRLLTENGSTGTLFHRKSDDSWCATQVESLQGSWEAGDLSIKKQITCSGKHITGSITDGQWKPKVKAAK